jgi:hypothetical protein
MDATGLCADKTMCRHPTARTLAVAGRAHQSSKTYCVADGAAHDAITNGARTSSPKKTRNRLAAALTPNSGSYCAPAPQNWFRQSQLPAPANSNSCGQPITTPVAFANHAGGHGAFGGASGAAPLGRNRSLSCRPGDGSRCLGRNDSAACCVIPGVPAPPWPHGRQRGVRETR